VIKPLRYSRRAISDLRRVWDYTLQAWGIDQAYQYSNAIREQCERLASGEIVGGRYQAGTTEFIKIRSGAHSIFLIEQEGQLLVVRIIHPRQDPTRELG